MTADQQVLLSQPEQEVFHRVRSFTGSPVRVSPASAAGSTVAGTLARVVVTGLRIHLEQPLPDWLQVGTAVGVEIQSPDGVATGTATVTDAVTGHLSLALPVLTGVVQRRRHPRVDVNLWSQLLISDTPEPVEVTVVNLSVGGAACVSATPQEPGTPLMLHLALPGLAPAELPARMVRCNDVGEGLWLLGLAFDAPNPAQVAKVAQYVASALQV